MAKSYAGPVRIGLIDLLRADVALSAMVAEWYDYMPTNEPAPYGWIGPSTGNTAFEGDDIDGAESEFLIHVLVEDRGRALADAIEARLIELVDKTTINIDSDTAMVRFSVERWFVLEETGEKGTWHVSLVTKAIAAIKA